jgi:hypothetical protein
MRIKCIACNVLARPVYLAAAFSPHIVDVVLERFGLHVTPNKLRVVLQDQVNAADQTGNYDAVALAYGLCGKAIDGLRAGSIPLVVPRAHDCITLFMGGRERYASEFSHCPGTYWYVQDYVERGEKEDISLSIGAFTTAEIDALHAEYVQKYGADNAAYLMEVMHAWQAHYERAAFIDMGVGDGHHAEKRAQDDAQRHGWRFERLAGDLVLIKRLLDADWDADFLVLQPGQMVEMSGDEEIVRSKGT